VEADNTGLVLITFPPSLDSEMGRFLTQHYGVRHREQRHTLIFSSFATLWHGFTVIFPLLYGKGLRLAGPRAIADYYDARCAPDLRLFPESPADRQQVEADWPLFNQNLAIATAVVAYYYLLPHRELMIDPLSSGTPDFEQAAVKAAYPVFAGLLRVLLQLNAQHVAKSLDIVRTTFSTVETRIAGGRSYLVGDRLTLSDLAFAVAAAPVVLPPNYGGSIPSFEHMPSEIQAIVKGMRARPAGVFALQIYQQQRDRFGATAMLT
jgi:glutathione S-transferase